jgi:peptidyl-prolyl cis-trans isomerase A (cyclophilin A)
MISRAVYSTLVFATVFAAQACRKEGASQGVQEADKLVEAEPDQAAEPEASADQSSESDEAAAESSEEKRVEKKENVVVVKLETTKGGIAIDVHPDWAPLGAERFLELVKAGFYTDVAFFRVMKGFMAQTGISGDPKQTAKWQNKRIKDDPVKKSNTRGMVTFATAGPNSRTTQFFINFEDNTQLDESGFAPFGKVRDMTAADALYSGYGDGPPYGKGPDQNKIKAQGNKFLKKKFPDLDYIVSAIVVE